MNERQTLQAAAEAMRSATPAGRAAILLRAVADFGVSWSEVALLEDLDAEITAEEARR